MSNYRKKYLTIDEQIELLKSRGMVINDHDYASRLLSRVAYYRLSGYWYPQRIITGGVRKDQFLPGTTLESIEAIYLFDKDLRIHVFKGIEIVEVALRAALGNVIGKHGSMAHTDPTIFRTKFSGYDRSRGFYDPKSNKNNDSHQTTIDSLARKTRRARHDFVQHIKDKYGLPLPVWVVTEVIDFSDLSKLYEGLLEEDQWNVVKKFNFEDVLDKNPGGASRKFVITLANWLEVLTFTRNSCAHHSRMWNANFTRQISATKLLPEEVEHLSLTTDAQRARIYPALVVIACIIKRIEPNTSWHRELVTLMNKFAETGRNEGEMGFVDNWRTESVWA